MVDGVVFVALSWEARAVLDGLQGVEPVGPRRWRGYLGDGAAMAVMQVGIGVERARRAAEVAPEARVFLSTGCAGGLAAGLEPGDLVVADRVLALDQSGRIARDLVVPAPAIADWAARRGIAVRTGAVASSPVVLAKTTAKARAGRLGALVVEMESAGVALAAAERGIECAVVKVVLDGAADEIAFPGDDLVDPNTGDLAVLRAVRTLAPRPHYWPAIARLARQQRTAERRLRDFLAVVFSAGLEALGGRVQPALSSRTG